VRQYQEGDEVSIGSISGVLSRIGALEAEITTKDGRVLVVRLGNSLFGGVSTPMGEV
jgi:hypothetical protein